MKRSTKIALGAAGIVMAAGAWSLMGGEDDDLVYSDPSYCRSDGKLTPEQCDRRFEEARAEHARSARRFSSQTACEGEYGSGRCETALVNGTSYWIPAFAGIMLARRFAAGGGLAQPLLPPDRQMCPPGSPAPQCQPRRSGSSGSGGGSSWRWYSTTSGGSVRTNGSSRSSGVSVTSRGGFGSTGRGFSSGG